MGFNLKYINVMTDINRGNLDEIQDFYNMADIKIKGKFVMPSFDESAQLQASMSQVDINSTQSIQEHLVNYARVNPEVAAGLANNIISGLRILVPSETAILSNYGKIAFWLRGQFSKAVDGSEHNIYVKTLGIQKHELYTLYLLSTLGNNIALIDFSFNKGLVKPYNNIIINDTKTSEHLDVSDKLNINFDILIDILTGTKSSMAGRVLVVGEDKQGRLNNKLIDIATLNPQNIMILKFGIVKPSFDEVAAVPRLNEASVDKVIKRIGPHMFKKRSGVSNEAAEFISQYIKDECSSGNKAEQTLISFICLYNRYTLDSDIILCYGKIDNIADTYTKFLAHIGKMVIVFDSSDSCKLSIDTSTWTEIRLDNIVDQHKYPEVLNSSTIAYNAQQEINQLLYSGDTPGLYRDRQYKTCDIAVLNSTFDEIVLLWKKENTVKPSFETTNTSVIVPVFYSKLMGCCKDYVETLGKLVTEHTVICYKPSDLLLDWQKSMTINHFADINGTLFKEQKPMYKAGKLDIDCIMQYKTFTYRFLDTGVQMHILSKLNDLITGNWINHPGIEDNDFVDIVLNTGLNMSKRLQQEMQWYDFTKQSPKLILLCQDEEEITLEQSIIITLLHLCGWDIAIAIPTCYNIMGQFLRKEFIQEHNLGEPKFDTNITLLQPTPEEKKKKGFFSNLFG